MEPVAEVNVDSTIADAATVLSVEVAGGRTEDDPLPELCVITSSGANSMA